MDVRLLPLVFASLLLLSTVPFPVAADAPFADAGLDQTVTKGATVHLDATESRDPDGTIESYEWTIDAPNGTTLTPECPTCGVTSFSVDTIGTYAVHVTVTDRTGEQATDTLYVEVEPGEQPSIVLTGPRTLKTGQRGVYVAEATAGSAPLHQIVWFVDGNPVSTTPVSGNRTSQRFVRHFASAAEHTVSARVVDIDGQSAQRTIETSITLPAPPTTGTSSGDRGTATIDGPRVLTGTEPLSGTYRVRGTDIADVTWWKDGEPIGSGESITPRFKPGDHALHARVTFTDGSDGVARFDDGTTWVVADPRPSIELASLNGLGGVNTTATATDAYGNLRTFEVRLDGATITSREFERVELLSDSKGYQLHLNSVTRVDPGSYTAELVATDGRGQTTTVRRRIEVRGPPEIVRSEFVYDKPLESYHPRIDPSRYTAKHVLEIDLNGVEPRNVTVTQFDPEYLNRVDNDQCTASRVVNDNRLTISSCWAISGVRSRTLETVVNWPINSDGFIRRVDELSTTPSDPEIRVRVISGGAIDRVKNWGLYFDVSNSFDPDGGDLIFNWFGGASRMNSRGTFGKFDSLLTGGLIITDDDKRTARLDRVAQYFNPRIRNIEEKTAGPYLPNETVRYSISTRYELTKGNYRDDVKIELIPSVGSVVDHEIVTGEFSADAKNRSYEPYISEGPKNYDQQFWVIDVPAEAFQDSQPTFETFNIHNRKETRTIGQLPEPVVLQKDEPQISETAVETTYLVEKPTYTRKETVYPTIRRSLENRGFETYATRQTGKAWSFERREKVEPAVYETSTRQFDERGLRATFLELNPGWEAAGSDVTRTRIKERKRVWRSERTGKGTFTGNTKRVQVRAPRYRTLHQYRYEYTTTEMRTRWRTKTYRYRDRVQYTDYVTRCNRYVGCYTATISRTKWVTRTATRRIRTSYPVQVEKTGTYWATGRRHPDHSFTGRTSMTLVEPAAYETRYEYVVERTRTIKERVFSASRTRLVEPAIYEWQPYRTTRSELVAAELEVIPDVRLSDVEPITKWYLKKQSGTTVTPSPAVSNESTVEKTRVTISGNLVTPYRHPDTGEIERNVSIPIDTRFTTEGYLSEPEAIEIYLNNHPVGEE